MDKEEWIKALATLKAKNWRAYHNLQVFFCPGAVL